MNYLAFKLERLQSHKIVDSLKDTEIQSIDNSLEALAHSKTEAFQDLKFLLLDALAHKDMEKEVISSDTLVTALITILVFFLGYLGNFFYQKYLAWSEAGIIRDHFHEWIDLHKVTVQEQTKNIRDFTRNLEGSNELQEEQLKISSFQLKKLLEISNLKLMNIFVLNSKGAKSENSKAYFNLINSLEYLSSFKERLIEKYVEFSNGTDQLRNDWNLKLKDFEEVRVSLIRSHANSADCEKNFAREVGALTTEIFNTKTPNGATNPSITLEEWIHEYFVPLRDMTNAEMSRNLESLDVQIMASKIEDLLIIYKRWRMWKSGYVSVLNELNSHLTRSFEQAENQMKLFKINKLKRFFKFQILH